MIGLKIDYGHNWTYRVCGPGVIITTLFLVREGGLREQVVMGSGSLH